MDSPDARNRIIEAVDALLKEGFPAKEITVRQIASRANVGIGTVNYHFQSKDRLIYETVNKTLVGMAESLDEKELTDGKPEGKGKKEDRDNPVGKLKDFLIQTSDLLLPHYDLYKVQINYELVQGDMRTPEYLFPLLQEIFGSRKSDPEIRLAALQIVSVMQAIFMNPGAFLHYSGVDIFEKEQRDKTIESIVNNIISDK